MIREIELDPSFKQLTSALGTSPGNIYSAVGLWGSVTPIVAALTAKHLRRPMFFVTAHLDDAESACDDMALVHDRVSLLPPIEFGDSDRDQLGEAHSQRARICHRYLHEPGPRVVVCPVQGLMQPVLGAESVAANVLTLTVGQTADPRMVGTWLLDHGFSQLDWVEDYGDYAQRGGILDICSHDNEFPLRVEFDDEQIASIRTFDISTGRSLESRRSAELLGIATRGVIEDDMAVVLASLPSDCIVTWDEPDEIIKFAETIWSRLDDHRGFVAMDRVLEEAHRFTQLRMHRFRDRAIAGQEFDFEVNSLERFRGQSSEAVQNLLNATRDRSLAVYCENEAEKRRLRELIGKDERSERIALLDGYLHRGFEWPRHNLITVGHHEIFGRQRVHRKIRRAFASRHLDTWLDLRVGDCVVHVMHGIGRFKCITTMSKGQSKKREEYLTLEFAEGAVIHVPTSQIDMVQKYIGVGSVAPALSKLGGVKWNNTKQKAQEAINEFAADMLRVQAIRQAVPGTAFPLDSVWQQEFEDQFGYTETEDQLAVMAEIKADLGQKQPMDRLICGDVGYGKTELAMRATFKVAEFGKQVAVLVPTTLLAEQHAKTFRERLADYPFRIACLSRLRSRQEQSQIIDESKRGTVDVLIGTHRLLSKDVDFADLGLLVIDEEQRFGVEHKEALKRLRESVDVLTLTATPIPRTLHLSLVGIRDISALMTPPFDRRSIMTAVVAYDRGLVRDAIVRELNRDGQVYFVHNFVHDIHDVADNIRALVPDARVAVAHGQMKPDVLEEIMLRFVNHDLDVLVCTTIIESGIDIPRANTIFIDQGDRFGLSDLHQLRGRVGRYHHRAYCYVLLPSDRVISPNAAKRLKSIEEYSELGAGFKIAMRDLEIRGAGNILGVEQSGHIAAVGYELYCQLLEQTTKRLKGDDGDVHKPVHVEIDVAAYIPKYYIRRDIARMDVYRRLAYCQQPDDVRQVALDLQDSYGPPPKAVQRLTDLAEIRVLARGHRIRSIIAEQPDIIFKVESLSWSERVFGQDSQRVGTVRMPDPKTIHWRLPESYFEGDTLLVVLRKLLNTR